MKNKSVTSLFILLLIYLASSINVSIIAENNNQITPSLGLTPHSPISITSDNGFEVYPGNGTVVDPYIIEGYKISTTYSKGISIQYTTKHFIIRNCYIEADNFGIYFRELAESTATIINNTCINNDLCGIWFSEAGRSIVANNTCINNGLGIILWYSDSSIVANNTCTDNDEEGIILQFTSSSIASNNTCYRNSNWGIEIYDSDSCLVSYNLFQENSKHGVYIHFSDNNLVHHNTFVNNNLAGDSQASGYGTNNYWYDTALLEGNYYSDWSGTGSYSIDGSPNQFDLYPLSEPPVDYITEEYTTPEPTPTETTTVSNLFMFSFLVLCISFVFIQLIRKKENRQ
ncbi:MAG: hypothetical protein GOP50_02680 [Candidatus Heimdallarchaeota archaeon]|nr:hypothetical protein [Candidatus Heimdallarchaeota archaeon]